jgi:importin-4
VVTEINRNAAATLKACGPALLGVEDLENQMLTVLASIITRSHPCQQDLGDEDDAQEAAEGSAEYDWLVIDTALDVVLGMAEALGPQFAKHWSVLQKPIIKFCSSQESLERSTAMGVIAEVVKFIGAQVTPFTEPIMKILLHRLSDPDPLTKSNTAYAVGQLIANSTNPAVMQAYGEVATKLESALSVTESRMQDNIAGCFSRMITRQPTPEVAEKLLPQIVQVLPLKEDYEENIPVFECIYKLCKRPVLAPCSFVAEMLTTFP